MNSKKAKQIRQMMLAQGIEWKKHKAYYQIVKKRVMRGGEKDDAKQETD